MVQVAFQWDFDWEIISDVSECFTRNLHQVNTGSSMAIKGQVSRKRLWDDS